MRYIFLVLLVALFAPNLGFGGRTPYGIVELTDYIIVPYAVVVFCLSRKATRPQLVDQAVPVLVAFVAWTLIGTLVIRWRFGYDSDEVMLFCLLKLAKFVLYCGSGLLTAQALSDSWIRRHYDWALLAAGAVLTIGLFTTSEAVHEPGLGQALSGYKSENGISVTIGILGGYLIGRYLTGAGSRRWRRAAPLIFVLMGFGGAVSGGRGGLLGGLIAVFYVAWQRGISRSSMRLIAASAATLLCAYTLLPSFDSRIAKTFKADPSELALYHGGVMGIDDGSRIYTWFHEAPKVLSYPFLGTGFFHRGGDSGLWDTGAHNFIIEIFLETGFVGGFLLIYFFSVMWTHAATSARFAGLGIPMKAALIAAFVSGMSEAYFYGGLPLMTCLLAYAPLGALAARSERELGIAGLRHVGIQPRALAGIR